MFPDVRDALAVVRPETVIRWHRAGFRAYWRWRSRPRRGRPTVPPEIRHLIRDMSLANRCGEPHGSMVSCSNSASLSGRRAWPSTWPGGGDHPCRAGGHFCRTMRTASPQWTTISFRFLYGDPWRTSSPLRPNLGFRYTQVASSHPPPMQLLTHVIVVLKVPRSPKFN